MMTTHLFALKKLSLILCGDTPAKSNVWANWIWARSKFTVSAQSQSSSFTNEHYLLAFVKLIADCSQQTNRPTKIEEKSNYEFIFKCIHQFLYRYLCKHCPYPHENQSKNEITCVWPWIIIYSEPNDTQKMSPFDRIEYTNLFPISAKI